MNPNTGKIVAIVLIAILLVAVCFATLMAIGDLVCQRNLRRLAEAQHRETLSAIAAPTAQDGNVTFCTDGEFRVLQLTDIHICGGVFSKREDTQAVLAVAKTIRETNPDLVIVTGDVCFAGFDNMNLSNRAVFRIFATLMDSLQTYWTVAYGNHDSEFYNFTSRQKITEYLQDFEYCLVTDSYPEIYGEANQFVNITNSQGLITQSLVLFDSGDYTGGRKYDYIRDDQIAWYENGIRAFNAQNATLLVSLADTELAYSRETYANVKSLAFFHIPTEEFRAAIAEYTEAGNHDTANVHYVYGEVNEPVCNSPTENDLVERMLTLGSTKGIFVGHDHTNYICLDYRGIRLTYSYSIDYYAYADIDKTDEYRGGTVITLYPDGTFTQALHNTKTLD